MSSSFQMETNHTRIQTENDTGRSKHVTQRCYFAFCLYPRPMEPSDLFRGGKLFQQYIVDAWASVEDSELYWVRNNQTTIRADLYDGLRDAMREGQGLDMRQMGRPSSYLPHTQEVHVICISCFSALPDTVENQTSFLPRPQIQTGQR